MNVNISCASVDDMGLSSGPASAHLEGHSCQSAKSVPMASITHAQRQSFVYVREIKQTRIAVEKSLGKTWSQFVDRRVSF